jgi:hypothetical protein
VPQEEDQDSILAIFIESDYKEMEQRKMRDVFSLEAGKLKTQAFFESIQS